MAVSTTKRSRASGKNHRIQVPVGRVSKAVPRGCLGLDLDYEDPPVPGTEGLDIDDPLRIRLEYEHSTTLAPGESWLTLPGSRNVDVPPPHPKSAARHAADARRMSRYPEGTPAEEVYEAEATRMRSAIRASSWTNPDAKQQPSYINAGNHRLSCFLKASLAGSADGYRNSTWSELVAEMGWSGDVLAEARQLAQDMGLLREEHRMGNGADHDDDGTVTDINTRQPFKKSKTNTNPDPNPILEKLKDKKLHLNVAEAFFEIMAKVGDDLKMVIDTKGVEVMWSYDHETLLWSIVADEGKFLDRQLQQAVIYLGARHKTTIKLLAEARKLVTTDPRMYPIKIAFDKHGMIPVKERLIDPKTLEDRPICKDDYCTWTLDIVYDKAAKCPWWLQMLADTFSNRSEEVSCTRFC